MSKHKISYSPIERVFVTANYVACTLMLFICFYPFYYVIINSLADPRIITRSAFFYPSNPSFTTYLELFKQNNIFDAFTVSVTRTMITTVLNVFGSGFFAYLLTKNMVLKKFVYRFVIVTMYFNAGLIPWYLTMKAYGLQNNFALYILPYLLSAYYIILIKTFIENLPASMEESAALDGAGMLVIYTRIIVPLSTPILATIAVFCAVTQWNTWQDNYFLIIDPKLQTIQLILYNYLNRARSIAEMMMNNPNASLGDQTIITERSVRMTIIVVAVTPILLVYPFLQKYFTKGVMLGAIKG